MPNKICLKCAEGEPIEPKKEITPQQYGKAKLKKINITKNYERRNNLRACSVSSSK